MYEYTILSDGTKIESIENRILFFNPYLHHSSTVYSKNGCPYCTKVQQVLELAELQHVVYKLGVDFSREEFYAEFGQGSTFPQVIVDEKHIGGCTDTVQYLKEQNLV
jgi:glutaredoxin 3